MILLRLIFTRRYPDLGGFFLFTAGSCKIAALIVRKHILDKFQGKQKALF